MYFLTYSYNNKEYIGVLNRDKTAVIPAEMIFEKLKQTAPSDMINFIELSEDLDTVMFSEIINSSNNETISLNDVKILAPIPYPKRNVICLGKNYAEHAKEIKAIKNINSDIPDKPIYFSKIAYPAIGQGEYINSHKEIVKELDYEAELAIIISKNCKAVNKEDAENYIFGYTIANDISARDIQSEHIQWHKGKSLDTFCSLGPYIVHKSGIAFPPQLEIKCYVNDELRQDGNTNQLIFDIPTIISDLSKGITLFAGDIILTGTPAGVGAGFVPPKYLKSGDIVSCYIESIGELTNVIK